MSALVQGRVVRSGGDTPVAEAALTLIDRSGSQLARARTGTDGRFTVDVPSAGGYVLVAAAPSCRPEAATIAVGDGPTHVDIELSPTALLSGTVRTTPTGPGIADVTITITDSTGSVVANRATAADGTFAFAGVPAGDYTLVAASPSIPPTAQQIRVPASGNLTHDLVLTSTTGLRAVVRTGDGTPVGGATVTVVDDAGSLVAVGTTDENGEHTFSGVAHGTYTVITDGVAPVTDSIHVVGGVHCRHDVRLGQEQHS
ncbi:carboxypeptidase regulatory-like domain-containing protein [Rhodococcus sp. HNM0569]|uniref:MSCRAMM family protein n=1 Tax=Rhodococcus sp. HNM0569 TaxID=2716340 RepID=UPI00146AE848|nr:carboxypeptidase regulatory-like domain-containing protein [Rhodococcus sp. HNM0569]NLU81591.1 carboxypeptidase regulatory-like domain-containing protein [Rhodococcus sp. HNM0569]